jgi:hypothetical protein
LKSSHTHRQTDRQTDGFFGVAIKGTKQRVAPEEEKN